MFESLRCPVCGFRFGKDHQQVLLAGQARVQGANCLRCNSLLRVRSLTYRLAMTVLIGCVAVRWGFSYTSATIPGMVFIYFVLAGFLVMVATMNGVEVIERADPKLTGYKAVGR